MFNKDELNAILNARRRTKLTAGELAVRYNEHRLGKKSAVNTNMSRMRYVWTIEDAIERIDFEEIKDIDVFRNDFEALLQGDIMKDLDSGVDAIRQQFNKQFACYELKKLIMLHSFSDVERRAQARREAAVRAAATRKAKAEREAKVKPVQKGKAKASTKPVSTTKKKSVTFVDTCDESAASSTQA